MEPLRTDANGRYLSPDIGDAGQAVRVVALPIGMLAARSEWVLNEQPTIEVRDIVPRRLREVRGRVVTRAGRGVDAAAVFHSGDAHRRVETTCDADGRFVLADVPEGILPLFVEKAGYRFTGILYEEGEVNILVASNDEAPAPLAGGPKRMPEADRIALGRRLLDQDFDAVVKRGGDREKHGAIAALGYLDPIEALDRLTGCEFADKTWREMARGAVIIHWIKRESGADWDEIRPVIESSEDQGWAATCYLQCAERMPATARQAKMEWINQATLRARQCDSPSLRTLGLARAALQLEALGDAERAAELRTEARKSAPQTSLQDEFAAAALRDLAAAFSITDLSSALEFLDQCDSGPSYLAACSQVAIHLASSQPEAAEKVWLRVAGREGRYPGAMYWHDSESPQFCFRLVAADPSRASRAAAEISDPIWRVRARGAVALAVAKTDVSGARRALRQAIEDGALAKREPQKFVSGRETAATTMAWLLPIAENVDPQLMNEVFWRALALRSPAPATDHLEDEVEIEHAFLLQMLARYDAPVARKMFASVAERINGWNGPAEAYRQKAMNAIAAAAAIDSKWAADLFEAMPDAPNVAFQHPKNECRRQIVRVLGMSDAELWEFAGYRLPDRSGD